MTTKTKSSQVNDLVHSCTWKTMYCRTTKMDDGIQVKYSLEEAGVSLSATTMKRDNNRGFKNKVQTTDDNREQQGGIDRHLKHKKSTMF